MSLPQMTGMKAKGEAGSPTLEQARVKKVLDSGIDGGQEEGLPGLRGRLNNKYLLNSWMDE